MGAPVREADFYIWIEKKEKKKDSFDLATGVQQMIQFTCDKLSPLLSRSVPYNKFEYMNIEKTALN